jgi:hypothetical protein
MNRTTFKAACAALPTIPDFSNYAVDHDGRVWRIARSASVRHRYLPPPYPVRERKTAKGYLNVSLIADSGSRRTLRVNRLVALAYHGPAPFGDAQAAHDDGNPANNSPDNITWKTPLENNRDKYRHGTMPRGETHWSAKRRGMRK